MGVFGSLFKGAWAAILELIQVIVKRWKLGLGEARIEPTLA